MRQSWDFIAGAPDSPYLLIADHASNSVPPDLNLGITNDLLSTHIALDIGVAELGRALCERFSCPGILGAVSRLVIDLNREEDVPGIIPQLSDGHAIPGNALTPAQHQARIDKLWKPYHEAITAQIDQLAAYFSAQKP